LIVTKFRVPMAGATPQVQAQPFSLIAGPKAGQFAGPRFRYVR
jgi:hypothetical protein